MTTRLQRLTNNLEQFRAKLAAHRKTNPISTRPSAIASTQEEWSAFVKRLTKYQRDESDLEVDVAMSETALDDYRNSRVKPLQKFEAPDSRMKRTAEAILDDELMSAAV